ncbi:endonuclease domain-containing protein [Bosea sp. RAF48]|uniref:endonuclease domain-containing protein n=1 Tax=Bosea sp. RAF48 TaxID=3237480 RepID=UPI003F9283F9
MTSERRQFARQLRQPSTRQEDALWSLLRNRQLDGLKFRRQVPLLAYTVDFICIDRKLIVEIDGRQHSWERDYDAVRTAEIERHGFKLVRFSNAEVMDSRDDVLATIRTAIGG